jgi:uncharacterized protein (DUF58 family)
MGWRALAALAGPFERLTREGKALATVVCGAAAFSVDVSRTESHVLLVGASSLLLASLFFTRGRELVGVTAEVRAPRRVAVGEALSITVSIRNEGAEDHRGIRIDPPRLSRDGAWAGPAPTLATLPASGRESAVLSARFSVRGEHRLGAFRAAALVPFGLAQGAAIRTEPLRFVVVPRLARVTSLTTPQGRRHHPGGVARASSTGDATELLGVRPYRPGDPIRDLHARSWARLGFPVVREYQQEYFTRVGVVVDTDARAGAAHLEAGLSLAAGIIARLCSGEALVDVILVGDRVHTLSLGRSLGTIDEALDVLASVRAGPALLAAPLLARLGPHLERLSSIVVVALSWDEERAAITRGIEGRGVGCAAFLVVASASAGTGTGAGETGRSARRPGGPREIPISAITAGEELAL